jgi:hypothetical protein
MNAQKTIILIFAGIVSIAISLLIIQLLMKKFKQKIGNNGELNKSFTIYFSILFLAFSFVQIKSITIMSEAVDNIYKIQSTNVVLEIFKTTSIFIGMSSLWYLLWYFISNIFTIIVTGNRKDLIEFEKDNYSYFLIKGFILIGVILSLSPILESFLRFFIPSIQIPFYH